MISEILAAILLLGMFCFIIYLTNTCKQSELKEENIKLKNDLETMKIWNEVLAEQNTELIKQHYGISKI